MADFPSEDDFPEMSREEVFEALKKYSVNLATMVRVINEVSANPVDAETDRMVRGLTNDELAELLHGSYTASEAGVLLEIAQSSPENSLAVFCTLMTRGIRIGMLYQQYLHA